MGKNKLKHFAENDTFPNMFQPFYEELQSGYEMKGRWNEVFFKNDHPIVLELGCGKGEYTVGLGKKYPNKNFIGIDVKGSRMWRGCKTSIEDGMTNIAFIRSKIQLIEYIFAENEISEIWITFPDPQPRHARQNRRLTSPKMLLKYSQIIKNQGIIHLKTDNEPLFDYTLEVIQEDEHQLIEAIKDLHSADGFEDAKSIKTYYEKLFGEKGFKINYLQFRLNANIQGL